MYAAIFLLFMFAPLVIARIVYNAFKNDLEHARTERKLKHGAIDELKQRHRRILGFHLFAVFAATLSGIILFGNAAIFMLLAWVITLAGHFMAYQQLHSRLSALEEVDVSRLLDTENITENTSLDSENSAQEHTMSENI